MEGEEGLALPRAHIKEGWGSPWLSRVPGSRPALTERSIHTHLAPVSQLQGSGGALRVDWLRTSLAVNRGSLQQAAATGKGQAATFRRRKPQGNFSLH